MKLVDIHKADFTAEFVYIDARTGWRGGGGGMFNDQRLFGDELREKFSVAVQISMATMVYQLISNFHITTLHIHVYVLGLIEFG